MESFSVIPISGMLETAAASVFWMPSMAQKATTTGGKKKTKQGKKKRENAIRCLGGDHSWNPRFAKCCLSDLRQVP